jgi:phenylacetate-CoA ligase
MSAGVREDHKQVTDLIAHAVRSTAFYARIGALDLSDLPVVTKAMYKTGMADFQSSSYDSGSIQYVHTSGSTGGPLVVAHGPQKRRRLIAETIYFNEQSGLKVGDRLLWLRAWTPAMARPRIVRFAQNIVPIEIVGMSDHEYAEVLRRLRRRKYDAILGYASTLFALARYVELHGGSTDVGLNVIISDSEALLPQWKRRITKAFGCPVVDRYANAENGILGCTAPGDDRFRLNTASYHFEFLRLDSNEAAGPGEPARVIVTDLYSDAMPIIRYDTGDLAVVAQASETRPTMLASIEGRRSDIIHDSTGREISGTTIGNLFHGMEKLELHQVIQDGPNAYRLRVVDPSSTYSDSEMIGQLRRGLGIDAQIQVVRETTIPPELTGKFRSVIANYAPEVGSGPSTGV